MIFLIGNEKKIKKLYCGNKREEVLWCGVSVLPLVNTLQKWLPTIIIFFLWLTEFISPFTLFFIVNNFKYTGYKILHHHASIIVIIFQYE